MLRTGAEYLLLFTIYAVLGWFVESVKTFFPEKKFINRGFLIGPYCPIYGLGAVVITLFFQNVDNLFLIFIGSLLLCGVIEYFTSFLMEKLFKSRWWDYHYKKFNLNGRICLEYLIYFGFAGILIIKVLNPTIFSIINLLTNFWLSIISLILIGNYLIDLKWSIEVASHLQKITKRMQDNTEIADDLRKIVINKYRRHNRILKAFPLIKKQINEEIWQDFSKR